MPLSRLSKKFSVPCLTCRACDTGALRPEFASFRIDELMRQIELEFAPLAVAKGLDLSVHTVRLVVRSDRRLLRRLIQNLVSNAIKYTPEGRVLVGCRRRGGHLQIDVYDTGVGIPQLKWRDIFVEFHRLDQGAKIARGLGLGLSIVERLARVLDCTIGLEFGGRPRFAFYGHRPTVERSTGRSAGARRHPQLILANWLALRRFASTTSHPCLTEWKRFCGAGIAQSSRHPI